MSLYDRIRIRREALGMSQEELAFKLGYKSRSSINKIELGKADISQSKIKAFADALDTTVAYLMGWDEDAATHDDILSKDESELLSRYRNLPENRKKAVLELLKDD